MNTTQIWYESLVKPAWAPAPALFGPVWSVLYLIIAVSYAVVFWKAYKREWPRELALPFVLNLIVNLAYSPIQFGLQQNVLAAVDILLVLATLVWALTSIWKRARWVAIANIPYLLWVSFATVLQLTITWLNRG